MRTPTVKSMWLEDNITCFGLARRRGRAFLTRSLPEPALNRVCDKERNNHTQGQSTFRYCLQLLLDLSHCSLSVSNYDLSHILRINLTPACTFRFPQPTMAPSVRGAASRVSKRQTGLQRYTKVSKIAITQADAKSKPKHTALSPVVNVERIIKSTPKRKREVHDDIENAPEASNRTLKASKKVRLYGTCIRWHC